MSRLPNIRVAVIGCGAVTEIYHLPALVQVEGIEVVSLVDLDVDRAKALAAQYGIARVESDFRTVLPDIDAAILALPFTVSGEIAVELLTAGIHLLVEKPMAATAELSQRMIDAADQADRILAVGLVRRFLRSYRFVKEQVADGALGKVKRVDFRDGYPFSWPSTTLFRFQEGHGVTIDTGSHALDAIQWWFGPVESFVYKDDSHGGAEANAELQFNSACGVGGVVELSWTRELRNSAIIETDHFEIEVGAYTDSVSIRPLDSDQVLEGSLFSADLAQPREKPIEALFVDQLDNWLQAIRGEGPLVCDGREGARSIGLIERCYQRRNALDMPWMTV